MVIGVFLVVDIVVNGVVTGVPGAARRRRKWRAGDGGEWALARVLVPSRER